jgi:hypothetical protein
MVAKDWIAVLALTISVVTLVWRIRDERVSYLQIGLSVQTVPGGRFALARASITNDSVRIKKLSAAFLLLGPADEDPIDSFNAAVVRGSRGGACCALDFDRLVPAATMMDPSTARRVIPLSYFTEENDNVGDEELVCSLPIGLVGLPAGVPLSVRFYVYGCRRMRQNYHRKVHDTLIVPPCRGSVAAIDMPLVKRADCRSIRGCPTQLRRK